MRHLIHLKLYHLSRLGPDPPYPNEAKVTYVGNIIPTPAQVQAEGADLDAPDEAGKMVRQLMLRTAKEEVTKWLTHIKTQDYFHPASLGRADRWEWHVRLNWNRHAMSGTPGDSSSSIKLMTDEQLYETWRVLLERNDVDFWKDLFAVTVYCGV
jgi:hypothetical protein